MDPLLFADWARVNGIFIRMMWTIAVVLVLVVGVALASPDRAAHRSSAAHTAPSAALTR
jgi:hypothetical protein